MMCFVNKIIDGMNCIQSLTYNLNLQKLKPNNKLLFYMFETLKMTYSSINEFLKTNLKNSISIFRFLRFI